VFIYLRGGRVLHENLIKKDSVSLLFLFYSLADDKQDITDIRGYIQQFLGEFNHVDAVATASEALANALKNYDIDAYYIPQFTNPKKFYLDYTEALKSEVLFVGNYSAYRQAVPTLLKENIPLSIYGDAWPEGVAKERYIDNRILRKYYSSAKIVLNDTRADMRKLGFISNRIFDATACGTLVISDYMKEIEEIYGDAVPMWKTTDELIALVKYYLDPVHEAERLDKAKRAREITLQNFTSDIAAQKFQAIIDDVKKKKGLK
jgi:spore maturation protein CgeB